MSVSRLVLPILVFLSHDACVLAKDLSIPGLEMDARSKELLNGWRAKEYNLDRGGAGSGECKLQLYTTTSPRRTVLDGILRFGFRGLKYAWHVSADGGAYEHGSWMMVLETLLRATGREQYLRNCRLRSRPGAAGTDVIVEGKSPYRAFRFDRTGVLVGISATARMPGVKPHPVEISLGYRKWHDLHLLRQYRVTRTIPSYGTMSEDGTLTWVRVRGHAVPVRVALEMKTASQTVPLALTLRQWKFGRERGPELDADARKAIERWEAIGYHPGLWRYRDANCRVSFTEGERTIRGTYRFESEQGRVDWDEPAETKPFGLTFVYVTQHWRKLLDHCFQRYWVRRQLGSQPVKTNKKDGRVEITEGLDAPGDAISTFVFEPNGVLSTIYEDAYDIEMLNVTTFRYHRQVREPGFHETVPFPHHVPVTWREVVDKGGPDEIVREAEVTYTKTHGVLAPRRILFKVKIGSKTTSRVIELSGWKLAREPLALD